MIRTTPMANPALAPPDMPCGWLADSAIDALDVAVLAAGCPANAEVNDEDSCLG